MRRFVVLFALLAACGSGADPSSTNPDLAATTSPGNTGTSTTAPSTSDAVPSACELLDADTLSDLLGFDVGDGSPMGSSPQRSICIYTSGAITAVEVAANYESSREIIDAERQTEEVAGIGNGAFYDPYGQVVAVGERYFVGITAPVSVDLLGDVAAALLDAAHGQ